MQGATLNSWTGPRSHVCCFILALLDTTALNLIQCMENNFSYNIYYMKNAIAPYINVMSIRKNLMLIYCVKLDHVLYSINYGSPWTSITSSMGNGYKILPLGTPFVEPNKKC